ncbi:unnamed protein product [Schistocephalus solidus]|uniref:Uncharacterized protein n=1 Tax=Schistocephalus solidus TaxID=70667 RepID=A0A3P7C3X8_SCHSO|nr:unnamed protein product [Schistocephalus solidus]
MDIQSLVTEYVGGFSMEQTLKLFPHKHLSEVIARTYFRQLLSAVIRLYEHDILIRGLIVYYLIVGTLPFQSPYFDHNRRKRIMRFTARGLTSKHTQAMQHLTQTCKVFLRQAIEPKAILRIPLLEIPENPWVTNQGKLVFQTFRPCDMHMKSDFETACQLAVAQAASISGSGSANFPVTKDDSAGLLENETNKQSLLKRMSHLLSGAFNCNGRRGRAEQGLETVSKNGQLEETAAVENYYADEGRDGGGSWAIDDEEEDYEDEDDDDDDDDDDDEEEEEDEEEDGDFYGDDDGNEEEVEEEEDDDGEDYYYCG